MASKAFFAILAQAVLIQAAFAQWVGNSVVDNNVVVNNGAGGLGGGALGVTGSNNGLGLGLAGNGLGLANGLAGVGVVGAGLGANLGGLALNNELGLGLGNVVVGGPGFVDLAALSAGGVLPITSVGPVVPAGLNVLSDNAIEGVVLVNGQLPFLSAAAFEGALATAGSGASSCGCGNGDIGVVSQTGSSLLPAAAGLSLGGLGGFSRLANQGLLL
ncbi:chorion class B protein PC10-like [Plodia interpunctella]|uniref:chorion class B protein PC10-like n=1 Tax=Plodia interpunctella TaxID=58824 RepID=UPI002367CE60|nr:chorion class B protein PC10-like [Plodia interpunctella]